MQEAVLVDAVRTPIGRAFKGAFAKTRSDDLGAAAIQGLLARTKVDPALVEDLLVGCAMTEGPQGYNVARQTGLLAGLPDTTAAATVNRFCSSSAYTIALGAQQIAVGGNECVIAGGLETMSMIPMTGLTPELYVNKRMWNSRKTYYNSMGQTAEEVARRWNIKREDMDRWGVRSHNRAEAAQKNGRFDREIVPVSVSPDGGAVAAGREAVAVRTGAAAGKAVVASGGNAATATVLQGIVVSRDEGVRAGATYEATAALKPAFDPNGVVTAGNASQMSDGAAMSMVASRRFADQHGLKPKARVVGAAAVGVEAEVMGVGPIPAVRKVLKQTGVKLDDVKMFEINEAFASQVLACIRELNVPEDIVNVDGGAIALGHPLGATGARIASHIVNTLHGKGGGYAIDTMCVGGGQGYALLLEVY